MNELMYNLVTLSDWSMAIKNDFWLDFNDKNVMERLIILT